MSLIVIPAILYDKERFLSLALVLVFDPIVLKIGSVWTMQTTSCCVI